MRVPFVIVITLVSLGLGVAGGKFWLANTLRNQTSTEVAKSNNNEYQPPTPEASSKPEQCNTAVPPATKQQTFSDPNVQKFYVEGKTYSAMREIICDIVKSDFQENKKQGITEQKVITALNDVLVKKISGNIIQSDIDLSNLPRTKQEINYLVDQVQTYQKQQNLRNKNGVIDINPDTYKRLKCDTAKKINSELSQIAGICPINQ